MKTFWAGVALSAVLLCSPAFAQTSTSSSTSGSQSASNAGATSTSSPTTTSQSAAGANNAGNAQSIVSNNYPPADQTFRSTPAVAAPGLTTTLTETCMGSTSVGVS